MTWKSELVQARERGQIRAGDSADRHVAPIGHPRHAQVSARPTSRLSAGVTAKIGELLGKGSALVITGSSVRRPPTTCRLGPGPALCPADLDPQLRSRLALAPEPTPENTTRVTGP
jgi:hypothetical protein